MRLHTTAEAAAVLGLSERRVRELAARGDLRGTRVGRDWVFAGGDLERFRAAPRPGPGRPPKGG